MTSRMKLTDVDVLAALESPSSFNCKKLFKERTFKKKEIITMPSDESNFVFIVKSGKVRVYLSYEDKEFTLSILDKGDIYSSHTRAFTEALENCELLISDAKDFVTMIKELPEFGLTIVKVLGDILKNSFTIINGLVFKDINARLAEFIIGASKHKGKQTDEGILLEIGLSTEEIAKVLGTSRQTVSLLLNDLYKSKILVRKGIGIIVIKNFKKLQELTLNS